ncbi:MAG: hypothetical protein ACSHXB_03995 [Sulfitobacter sp.]
MPATLTDARRTFRRAIIIGTIIAVLVGGYVLFLDLSTDPNAHKLQTDRPTLPVPWTLFSALFLGMGLGTQLSLLWANWHRVRAVLKPNIGRLTCAALLALLAPVAQFWAIPISFGYALLETTSRVLSDEIPDAQNWLPVIALFVLYPLISYVFSSLIISGIQHRWLRIAVFGQVWLAAYGAVLMIFGMYSGNL